MHRRPGATSRPAWSVRTCALASSMSVLLFTACDRGSTTRTSAIVERDSAGVSIVEHPANFAATLPELVVDTTPIVSVGTDTTTNMFVNIVSAVRRSDGKFVVLDSRAAEVRQFSESGQFEKVLVRRGGGPGEFGGYGTLLLMAQDSLVVFDTNQRRAMLFAPSGDFVRQHAYPRLASVARVTVSSMLADGRMLVQLIPQDATPTAPNGPVIRDDYALALIGTSESDSTGSTGMPVDTIAVVPGNELFPTEFDDGEDKYLSYRPLIMGKTTRTANAANTVIVGTNVSNELRQYDGTKLVRIVRSAAVPAAVTDADKKAGNDYMLSLYSTARGSEQVQERLKSNVQRLRYASVFPFYERIRLGSDNSLWVSEPAVGATESNRFTIYNASGHAVAKAVFPADAVIMQRSLTEALVVRPDENDVPRVMVWKITEPSQ